MHTIAALREMFGFALPSVQVACRKKFSEVYRGCV